MSALVNALLLGGAGAVGTLLRAGCNMLAMRLLGPVFPWGTFLVNISGSFAFGAIMAMSRSRAISTEQAIILLTGLVGGFTTYSSFAFQSAELLAEGRLAAALAYTIAMNLLCVVAVWVGLQAGRAVL